MKDILIDSTDDHFIVVSIPESEAESYQKRLESDPEFRENEIRQALGGTSADSRALPPGHIEYQSYMYKSDIKAAVDAASGSGTFDNWLTALGWTVSAADIAKLIRLSKRDNIFILAADILGTLVQWAQQEREAWWKEAYKDIINGTISAVRYTIVQHIDTMNFKIFFSISLACTMIYSFCRKKYFSMQTYCKTEKFVFTFLIILLFLRFMFWKN